MYIGTGQKIYGQCMVCTGTKMVATISSFQIFLTTFFPCFGLYMFGVFFLLFNTISTAAVPGYS